MNNGWDNNINLELLSDTRRLEIALEKEFETRDHRLSLSRKCEIPLIIDENIVSNFSAWSGYESGDSWRAGYSVNRIVYVCHDCGLVGLKYESPNELFKCPNSWCYSRNISIYRAGEISIAIRENTGVGIKMVDVYNNRRIRLKEERERKKNESR